MRQFNLQTPLGRRSAFAEYFEDQPSTVYDLALELVLKITLLDCRQRAVDNDQFRIGHVAGDANALDLPFTEQGCGPNCADWQDEGVDHFDADGAGEALPLFEAVFRIDAKPPSPLL